MSSAERPGPSTTEEDELEPGQRASVVAAGLDFPEGPVWLGHDSWLVVEMSRQRGCVTAIENGVRRAVTRTGRPNGLALAADGAILVAEPRRRAILRIAPGWRPGNSNWTILADRDERGRELLFPNDLCIGPDGFVYVTDSGLALDEMERELLTSSDPSTLPFDGRLYCLDVRSGDLATVDGGLGHLNGISVGVDNALYTNETVSGDVYRYPITDEGIGPREIFSNVIDRSLGSHFRGPDGMAHDVEGNLYVTVFNQGEVVVLDRNGEWVDRIPTRGSQPTNVAFGEGSSIHVTERETGTLQRLPALAPGLRLPGLPSGEPG